MPVQAVEWGTREVSWPLLWFSLFVTRIWLLSGVCGDIFLPRPWEQEVLDDDDDAWATSRVLA